MGSCASVNKNQVEQGKNRSGLKAPDVEGIKDKAMGEVNQQSSQLKAVPGNLQDELAKQKAEADAKAKAKQAGGTSELDKLKNNATDELNKQKGSAQDAAKKKQAELEAQAKNKVTGLESEAKKKQADLEAEAKKKQEAAQSKVQSVTNSLSLPMSMPTFEGVDASKPFANDDVLITPDFLIWAALKNPDHGKHTQRGDLGNVEFSPTKSWSEVMKTIPVVKYVALNNFLAKHPVKANGHMYDGNFEHPADVMATKVKTLGMYGIFKSKFQNIIAQQDADQTNGWYMEWNKDATDSKYDIMKIEFWVGDMNFGIQIEVRQDKVFMNAGGFNKATVKFAEYGPTGALV